MVGVAVAFAISLVWAIASVRVGPAIGWVDKPDANPDLKVHERAAVPLGGIGIFVGVHVALWLDDWFDPGLFVATLIVLGLGLVDDRAGLSPKLRLVIELAAGVVLVTVADVGVSGPLGIAFGALLVVIAINAVNLYDGLDGLVGVTAVVSALGIALLTDAQTSGEGAFGLVVAAALGGFLVLNWSPAKVFLGDNGAYAVAVFLVYGILTVNVPSPRATAALRADEDLALVTVISIGLLGVFLLDLAVTLIRRRINGRALFEGDRSHVYDQLRDRGRSVKRVAALSALAQAVMVGVVYVAAELVGGVAGLELLGAVVVAVLVLARVSGFLRVDA